MFSVKGDTVLDPFAGSGITGGVVKSLGRKSISITLRKGVSCFFK